MDKAKIIELLRKDMMGEQQAIVQYLYHAYHMEEGAIPAEVEGIAREEMRHFDWLGDAITELGGDPSLERDPVDFEAAAPSAQLAKNVDLEQVAIDQYRQHIALIDNPKIQRLLSRILHDELVHKGMFENLVAEAKEELDPEAAEKAAAPAQEAPARMSEILNQGIRHEYTVILQYLFHSFMAEDKEAAEELMNAAINEMQHMGWLSEELAENGGKPIMEHGKLFLSRDTVANLEADIAVEQEVTRDYTSQIGELKKPDLVALVERIRDHEIYHDALFKDLLEEVKEKMARASEPCEPQAEVTPDETPAPEQEPERDAAEQKPPSIPSVGSLKD